MNTTPRFVSFGDSDVEPTVKDTTGSVVAGDPVQHVWLHVDDSASATRFGHWDCAAGTFRATMDGITEFCCIVEGEADITDLDSGITRTVRAGDAFVMEAGLRTEWTVGTYVKKLFAISRAD